MEGLEHLDVEIVGEGGVASMSKTAIARCARPISPTVSIRRRAATGSPSPETAGCVPTSTRAGVKSSTSSAEALGGASVATRSIRAGSVTGIAPPRRGYAGVLPGAAIRVPRGGVERARNVASEANLEVIVELKRPGRVSPTPPRATQSKSPRH